MQDLDAPPRRDDADEAETASAETRMRLALERLGTRSNPVQGGPGSRANIAAVTTRTTRAAPQLQKRFVRDGDVPVERVPSPVRLSGEVGRDLAEERAARQRTDQALAEALATISRLQAALSRAEEAARVSREAVEEREAAMAGLRAELGRVAQREAALAEAAQAEAERQRSAAKLKRVPAPAREPEPVRWWLDYLKVPRS